jgi:hypothetical protein
MYKATGDSYWKAENAVRRSTDYTGQMRLISFSNSSKESRTIIHRLIHLFSSNRRAHSRRTVRLPIGSDWTELSSRGFL